MTREQIEENAKTYFAQASLVLDAARTEIRYNSEWSDPLGARGMIELSAKYTVAVFWNVKISPSDLRQARRSPCMNCSILDAGLRFGGLAIGSGDRWNRPEIQFAGWPGIAKRLQARAAVHFDHAFAGRAGWR